ncbi:MAG: HAMP domain-containing protein [Ruminococcaceae bacterium]|nr:HAMP domain-containing protein [Oscillospiraceae bacterium]
MQKNKRSKNPRHPSLTGKMILSFAMFGIAVLLILWLFQTVLLDDIYMHLKQRSLTKCAREVTESVDGSLNRVQLDQISSEAAKKYGICISAYSITSSNGRKMGEAILDKHINSFCFIHNMKGESLLNKLYLAAVQNGGTYKESFSISSLFGKNQGDSNTGENVIYCNLVPLEDKEVLLVFNAELMPLTSTVDTIRAQLVIISVIILAVAVVMAIIFSVRISRPIREMSEEATKLAVGNYNVNFDGGNCKETANLSATLNRAAYELSKLDRMQKDLIANVSHDLRTPLTMIAGYTEAMRDLPGEATPENMQIVIDETARLTSLVNDMLEVSKYQNTSQVLKITKFNLTEVLRTTLERYSKLKERDGYKIICEADCDVYVEADENRILQVLYNLINNAVNYTGEDKTVIIRQTVSVSEGKKQVLIEVIDSGRGISEDELPLVWERYYKVHDFHKRADMGTGLGLSIVKNILLLHRSEFGVNSKVGHGSCFWFKLDVAE